MMIMLSHFADIVFQSYLFYSGVLHVQHFFTEAGKFNAGENRWGISMEMWSSGLI